MMGMREEEEEEEKRAPSQPLRRVSLSTILLLRHLPPGLPFVAMGLIPLLYIQW